MKLALIQDQLLTQAGSERIFQYMVEEFPKADIFTLAYNPDKTWPKFRNYKINTSWANSFIQDHSRFKLFFPLSIKIMKHWNLWDYHVILSSSATVAKYISRFKGIHLCYCYFPTRAIWNTDIYFGKTGFKEKIFCSLLPLFRYWDLAAAKRIHRLIAISESSRRAIWNIYGRKADVLNCPIDYDHFNKGIVMEKGEHYLIVSRLERWKYVDYAIEAFNRSGRSLRIIGTGEHAENLKSIAKDNITFLGNVDDDTLAKEYGRARAVIFTPELEYGLVPLEANASGTPVIALEKGGVTETMIPANRPCPNTAVTAVLFKESTPKSLNAALSTFEHMTFSREALACHAKKYSIPIFKKALRRYVEGAYSKKC